MRLNTADVGGDWARHGVYGGPAHVLPVAKRPAVSPGGKDVAKRATIYMRLGRRFARGLPELEGILGRPVINRYGMTEAYVIYEPAIGRVVAEWVGWIATRRCDTASAARGWSGGRAGVIGSVQNSRAEPLSPVLEQAGGAARRLGSTRAISANSMRLVI